MLKNICDFSFLKFNKTLAIVTGSLLATNVAGVVLSSNISYNNGLKVGNSEGQTVLADVDNKLDQVYNEGRESGWVEGQEALVRQQQELKANPVFDSTQWDSEGNKLWLEHQIEGNMSRGTQNVYVMGSACFASTTQNKWHCVWRETGKNYSTKWDIEVNPRTQEWKGTQFNF